MGKEIYVKRDKEYRGLNMETRRERLPVLRKKTLHLI